MLALVLATAALGCGGGETIFQEGPLRIFGTRYRSADEEGWSGFGCRRGGRRVEIGGEGSTTGVASYKTRAYAVDGTGRYVGAYQQSDSEGGPDADYTVYDLRTRRYTAFENGVCCHPAAPSFRVTSDGTLITADVIRRRGRKTLRTGGRDVALVEGTVYWTDDGVAKSRVLPGMRGGESRMLTPVTVHSRRGPCIAARGTTVAAWPHIRVVRRGGKLFACRDRSSRRIRLDGVPLISGDRWLLDGSRLIDSLSGRVVVRGVGSPATLLRDGRVAWLDGARLLTAAPGGAPVELSAAASALASGRKTIYWTEASVPRSFSKPG